MNKKRARQLARNRRSRSTKFGYDAAVSSPHRRAPQSRIKSEDAELKSATRKKLQATAIDQRRNHTLPAWMIRRHLDYVSRFYPTFRSGNPELDKVMRSLLKWHGSKQNFDIAERHSRDEFMRIFEGMKVVSGDIALIKLKNGKLQGIESDRIAKPGDFGRELTDDQKELKERVNNHGLILNDDGAVEFYCICNRDAKGTDLVFSHFEKAGNIIFDGYFQRYDQSRGVSPLVTAINDVADHDDVTLYSKLNLKLKNLFGIAILRNAGSDTIASNYSGGATVDSDDGDTAAAAGQKLEFSPEKISILDLENGEKIESIESNSPSANAMEFMDKLVRITMLALDIPYTAYDSSKASFSARIADRAEYEESAAAKRQKNEDVLREIYEWRIREWYNQDFCGLKKTAEAADVSIDEILIRLDFVPAGKPWLDKLNETKGEMMALAMGAQSTPRLCSAHGLDAYQLIDEQAEYLAYAKKKEVPLLYGNGGVVAVQNILTESTGESKDAE